MGAMGVLAFMVSEASQRDMSSPSVTEFSGEELGEERRPAKEAMPHTCTTLMCPNDDNSFLHSNVLNFQNIVTTAMPHHAHW